MSRDWYGRRRREHGWVTVVRLALAVALLLPVLEFVVQYLWMRHTLTGVVPAFIDAALYGAQDSLVAALNDPVRAVIYFVLVGVLSRIAFGRRSD